MANRPPPRSRPASRQRRDRQSSPHPPGARIRRRLGVCPRPRRTPPSPRCREKYGLFIDGAFVPQIEEVLPHPQSRHRRAARAGGRSGPRRCRGRGGGGPAAYTNTGDRWRRKSGRNISTASPGCCRSAPASSRWLESLDGGKPIRESRDIDIPLAAAHFFYHAGWADKLAYAFPGRNRPPLGVAGQVIPWNFPAADGGLENCAGPRLRQHGRAEARRDHAAHGDASATSCIDIGLPPGVVNIVPGGPATGAALVAHPGDRQGRLHRFHRGGQADPAASRGPANA